MAIIDKNKRPLIQDNDENQFIGIMLPFIKSDGVEGWFKSTEITIDAVTENIKLLLLTEKGERLMQPTIGLGLRAYLFQQIDNNTIDSIKSELTITFETLMPFITIKNVRVNASQMDSVGKNQISIRVDFHLNRDPNILNSVSVDI
tara:strand:- start:29363 stop:29800 length:438 start_codon:yes stop_codon:yes gene_type:complete